MATARICSAGWAKLNASRILTELSIMHRLKARNIERKSDELKTDQNEEEVKAVEKSSPKELVLKHVETTDNEINGVKETTDIDIEVGKILLLQPKGAGERINLSGDPTGEDFHGLPEWRVVI